MKTALIVGGIAAAGIATYFIVKSMSRTPVSTTTTTTETHGGVGGFIRDIYGGAASKALQLLEKK